LFCCGDMNGYVVTNHYPDPLPDNYTENNENACNSLSVSPVCDAGTDVCLYLQRVDLDTSLNEYGDGTQGRDLIYTSTQDILRFQFTHSNCPSNSATAIEGGAAEENNFILNITPELIFAQHPEESDS